jgi:predicted nucleic acid-binding protein
VSVLTEAALLVEARLGMAFVRRLWDDVLDGVFEPLAVTPQVLALARAIDRRYGDANFGLVDCSCLALCELNRIATVFTYDRRDFALYRPAFTEALTLVP